MPPTAKVVRDFSDISLENELIVTMDWIIKGITLIFLGILTICVTKTESENKLAKTVYILITGMFGINKIDFSMNKL